MWECKCLQILAPEIVPNLSRQPPSERELCPSPEDSGDSAAVVNAPDPDDLLLRSSYMNSKLTKKLGLAFFRSSCLKKQLMLFMYMCVCVYSRVVSTND